MTAPVARLRCLAVWSVVTAVALVGSRVLLPGTGDLASPGSFDQLLVGVSTLALLGCLAWGWLVTTAVVVEALLRTRGARRPTGGAGSPGVPGVPGVPPWARRVVLAACGTALAVGVAPAQAAPGSLAPGMPVASPVADVDVDGLPFPDRPTGPDRPTAPRPPVGGATAPRTAAPYVVRAGDSLWAITAQALTDGPARPEAAEVADLVARTYADNHRVVGDDPDLILPGQRLRLPPRT